MSNPNSDGAPAVQSPCIKLCVLDPHQVCMGCGRHIDEISGWSRLSAQQQRSICEQAARRLAAMRHMLRPD